MYFADQRLISVVLPVASGRVRKPFYCPTAFASRTLPRQKFLSVFHSVFVDAEL